MKNIFKILLVLVTVSVSAIPSFAQNGKDTETKNWFIGAGAGMNFGFNGSSLNGINTMTDRTKSNNGAGTAADFYIGKYFNRTLGFRVGFQGFGTSDVYTDYGKERFNYAHADLLLRAGKVFVPYLHAGYAQIKTGTPAGGIGLMAPIRLSPRISIIPDLKATALNGKSFTDGTKNIGVNLSATVGLQINLGRVSPRKTVVEEPVVYEAPEVKPEPKPEPQPEPEPVIVKEEKPAVPEKEIVQEKVEQVNKSLSECVVFEFDRFTLTQDAQKVLDTVVAFMKQYPSLLTIVEGHTDNIGPDRYNLDLSQKRAKSVVDYIVSKGIPADSVTYEGFGETRPVDTNATPEGRARNRRVEIRINGQ